MKLKNREKQEPATGNSVSSVKDWEKIAALMIQKRTPKFRSLLFSEKIPGKYAYVNKFNHIKKPARSQNIEQKHLMGREFPLAPELNTEINKKESSFETKSEKSNYFHIDPGLKDFLGGFLNIHIPHVKIFTDKRSDAMVRKFSADALTHDDKIFFKTGKFDPGDKRGIALLGHELTHAAKSRMQDQNVSSASNTSEEQQALINEKKVLHYFSSTEPHNDDKKSPSYKSVVNYSKGHQIDSEVYRRYETPASPNTSGNYTNMNKSFNSESKPLSAALTSRDLSLPVEANSSVQLSEQQFRSIKDEIYLDLIQRIKIEFERGG